MIFQKVFICWTCAIYAQTYVANINVTTAAGNGSAALVDGIGSTATFHSPSSICYNDDLKVMYVIESTRPAIRRISVQDFSVTTHGLGKYECVT